MCLGHMFLLCGLAPHNRNMAEPHTIETYALAPHNRNIWPSPHTIETYGLASHNRNIWPSAHNRNIWPHNSRAAAAPSRLADSFVWRGSCTYTTTTVL